MANQPIRCSWMCNRSKLVTQTHSSPTDDAPSSERPAFRIAAIGDLHLRAHVPEILADELATLDGEIDLLVVAGDITDGGRLPEIELATRLFSRLTVPTVAVFGNHDRRGLRRTAMRKLLKEAGVVLLDGTTWEHTFADGRRIGIAGVGGYGGGFWPDETPEVVGARLSKAVGVRARREALRLKQALSALDRTAPDARLALMHYAPTVSTLGDEPPRKYWMLGNSLLGNVIDQHHVDLVIHGHAHLGNEHGQTRGGVPVRNVAAHVTGGVAIYELRHPRHVASLSPKRQPAILVPPHGLPTSDTDYG